MRKLIVLRHFPTLWNEEKRRQGRRDIPLSAGGLKLLHESRVPNAYLKGDLFSSPLQRAQETAIQLWGRQPLIEERLIELSFGDWEGLTKDEIHVKNPNFPDWPGLDEAPPGGESLRQAQNRLKPWLEERFLSPTDTIAVTHKGVILALHSLATGWAGHEKPRPRPREGLHIFEILKGGGLRIIEYNVSLLRA